MGILLRDSLKVGGLIAIAVSMMALTLINNDGPPAGMSWHGGSGTTCFTSGCHGSGNMAPNSPTFAVTAAPTFTPGTTVPITVTFGATGRSAHGFEASVGDPDASHGHVGGLAISDATNTRLASADYVSHANPDQTSWSFNWNAPDPAPRRVTFWVTGLAADSKNNSDTYRDSLTIFNTVFLPVELAFFDAHLDGRSAVLNWRTESETNNAGFEVEHAQPSNAYEVVDFVPGAGTTTEARDYLHIVSDLGPGAHRFRIRQIDLDGTATLSQHVELLVEVADAFLLSQAYPNPFNPTTTFDVAVREAQTVRVAVFDEAGRLVTEIFRGSMAANQVESLTFDASGRASGVYQIRVTGETFVTSRSVVLVK